MPGNPTCGHCGTAFFPEWKRAEVFYYDHGEGGHCVASARCPSCHGIIVRLEKGDYRPTEHDWNRTEWEVDEATIIFPTGRQYPKAPEEVPEGIRGDFHEAWEVLPISPKAAAALARRCLQAVLAAQGYDHRDLIKQVEAALHEADSRRALPSALHEAIDTIRVFGNFSAHPINDLTTLQVIDVQPGEAEFCLRLLGELFDHYYVRPHRYQQMKQAGNERLTSAGRSQLQRTPPGSRSP